jgi:uridine kinase
MLVHLFSLLSFPHATKWDSLLNLLVKYQTTTKKMKQAKVRPKGPAGDIILEAKAEGLASIKTIVTVKN